MDSVKKAQFEAILEKYNLNKEANWKPFENWVELADKKVSLEYQRTPSEQREKIKLADKKIQLEEGTKHDLFFIDSVELIELIQALEGSWRLSFKTNAGEIELQDENLKYYLLLSLHKLLQLRWGLDKPNEEELKEGKMGMIIAAGSESEARIEIKKELEGERGNFIQPYSAEELETLKKLELGLKKYHKVREGRGGKNIAFLGDKVAEALTKIPKEVKDGLSKTDLLLFVADVMALAGFLDDVEKWKKLSKELEENEANNFNNGSTRKEIADMLKYWLKGAKKAYCEVGLCKKCRECENFGTCSVSMQLQSYDI